MCNITVNMLKGRVKRFVVKTSFVWSVKPQNRKHYDFLQCTWSLWAMVARYVECCVCIPKVKKLWKQDWSHLVTGTFRSPLLSVFSQLYWCSPSLAKTYEILWSLDFSITYLVEDKTIPLIHMTSQNPRVIGSCGCSLFTR